jgi:hypothetical protein
VLAREDVNRDLFADPQQSYAEAVQFYRHDVDWRNRMILGDSFDSLQLAQLEGASNAGDLNEEHHFGKLRRFVGPGCSGVAR